MNLDESELQTDPKYKAYVTSVEKALKSFEYSSEWADLISALGKLIKVLQANSRYSIIPKRLLIGKRLAQCTHPALPSGVHLKALEVYSIIFKTIGPKHLCNDMFIYSAGLFPLLSYAAMPVKPKLLEVYEEYYLPLGEHLKPALTGLLQGILPGLEEGSDFSDRTNTLLTQLCAGMLKSSFYGALWECVLTSPTVRLPAVTFVLSQVDYKVPISDQHFLFGTNRQLMVRSVCAALYDTVVLVQRSILDLVLICFPTNNSGLSNEELTNVITAGLNTLLRRDMSLNRRLFAWLLGDKESAGVVAAATSKAGVKDIRRHQRSDSVVSTSSIVSIEERAVYFETHSKKLLIESLKTWLHNTPEDSFSFDPKINPLRPYRLLISLLDKPEVSGTIMDDIFIEVFRALYMKCTREPTPGDRSSQLFCGMTKRTLLTGPERPMELIKTANLLFSTFEAYFMWDYVAKKFEQCCQQSVIRFSGKRLVSGIQSLTCSELCVLVDFLLEVATLEAYMETPTEYLPQLLCKITMSLTNYCNYLSLVEIHDSLQLCLKLMTKVQPSMVLSPNPVDHNPLLSLDTDDELPKGLMKRLEGIESDYEMVEDASLPPDDLEELQESDSGLNVNHVNEELRNGTAQSESSESTEQGNSISEDEDLQPQSLDRLSSNPAALPPTPNKSEKLRRPMSLSSWQDSIPANSEEESDTFSPSDSELVDKILHRRTLSMTTSTSLGIPESETPPLFLMQACVQCYQNFFAKFVNKKIMPGAEFTKNCIRKLQVITQDGLESEGGGVSDEAIKKIKSYMESLEDFEEKGVLEEARARTHSNLTSDSAAETYLADVSIECNNTEVAIKAFSTACNLLVEFACFPMYCNENVSAALLRPAKVKGCIISLPLWLQVLLSTSCFVNNFDLQTTAISTVLELIAMTKSVASSSDTQQLVLPNPPNSPKSDTGKISVVLVPAISSSHLDVINSGSTFFQRVAVNLWHHLNPASPEYHTRSTDLLHSLHNVTPDVYICENVIGNSLMHREKAVSLNAHIKFALLWHLIRSQILVSSPASRVRTFDRSLLVMLDSLDHVDSMSRCVTQTWLIHAIDRGDIARLLEPILLVMLHPTTARVSVQYLGPNSLHKKELAESRRDKDKERDDSEKRIFSISSINGEVKYFVFKNGQKLMTQVKQQDPVLAMTAVDDKRKVVTKANVGFGYSQPAKVLSKPLNVTVNPFSQYGNQSDSDSEKGTLKATPPVLLRSSSNSEGNGKNRGGGSKSRRVSRVSTESAHSVNELSSSPKVKDDKFGVSNEDLSESDTTEELSYVFNEEVEETVEEIVQSLLEEMISQVAEVVDGVDSYTSPDEDETQAETARLLKREKMQSQSARSIGRGHNVHSKVSEDFVLDELEGVISEEESPNDIELGKEVYDSDSHQEAGYIKLLSDAKLSSLHPLQQHILLYVQVYDTQRILYVLSRLRSILQTCSREFVCAMSSTSVSSTNTPQLIKLQQLLARHKRCMFGKDFYYELDVEAPASLRSLTYLEILLQTCIHYIRSYYPTEVKAETNDAMSNRDVQIASMEVLQLILQELIAVAKDSGKGLATFICDLLLRCKVQKAILYCLLASVYNGRKEFLQPGSNTLNEIVLDAPAELSNKGAKAFQLQLLKLSQTIICLEDQLFLLCDESSASSSKPEGEWEFLQLKFQSQNKLLGFERKDRFSCQGLLHTALLSALKQHHNCHMHRHWIGLVTSCLSYLDKGLPRLAISVTNQVCRNLELLSSLYSFHESKKGHEQELDNIPPDHVVSMLEGLTTICHFCLLESTANVSTMSGRHAGAGGSSPEMESIPTTPLFSSLLGALTRDKNKISVDPSSGQSTTPKMEARRGLLSMFPKIISSIAKIWAAVQKNEKERDLVQKLQERRKWSAGSPKAVRQQILELLSPIALQHSTSLLAAIGVVWSENRKRGRDSQKKVLVSPSEEQLVLVELVGAIRALPPDTLVQTIKHVLKTPPFTIKDKNQPSLEVSMLQFLFASIQKTTSSSLRDSWPSMLSLLKDALQLNLSPPGQFLLFGILNEIVQKVNIFEERKDQRDLQEICQKLVEACNLIAGSSLEQTTWLRRNMTVKFSVQEKMSESEASDSAINADETDDETQLQNSGTGPNPTSTTPDVNSQIYSQYSVHALTLLAELLAHLLDLIYGSEEKEKVVPMLTSIMHNVTPYLKNHSTPNVPSFRACTSLLSSLSGYQYTRKAWKKDALELFLDSSFFQMDPSCTNGWRVIIDNLMTHDRTTFKDLMARVAAFQNTSLNLFASKELEMEQRAQFLKRLSFTIFCSESDQYTRSLPDIQERLAESLRLIQVPVVHEQVFQCFRVLLLRFSSHHLTGLWPTMISEMVQVFLHLEEQLSSASGQSPDATKKSAFRRVATADIASFFQSSSSGSNSSLIHNKSWLSLYLSTSKLLDLALCLPSDTLPQFQVYKWAFVGENFESQSDTQFIPHVARVAKLLRAKQNNGPVKPNLQRISPTRPYLAMTSIKSIDELLPFFNTLCSVDLALKSETPVKSHLSQKKPEKSLLDGSYKWDEGGTALCDDEFIERLIERDFLVPLF